VRAALHDRAFHDHADLVAMLDGAEAVRDDEARLVPYEFPEPVGCDD
jgi:hypothetical protein